MNFVNTVITSIFSGLITSIIVFVYWQMKKPNLSISKEIAKNKKGEYRIKIVNNSNFYVTDIQFQLQFRKITNGGESPVYKAFYVELPYQQLLQISPYSKKDKEGNYAIRVVLPMNFEEYWDNDETTMAVFIIKCSNEYNTASKVFTQEYRKKACIKSGEFACLKSMEIC